MSAINREKLIALINEEKAERRLVVTPLLSPNQIGPGSIDVRLGSSIIVPKRTFVASHDVTKKSKISQVESRLYQRLRLRYKSEFILHPNQLILAVTFEYLSLPANLFCQVASRSSWGRLGIVVATASVVQPGFKGSITLELANLSDSPVSLYPGLSIGQLVFFEVSDPRAGAIAYQGRYECPTEAGLPQFYANSGDDEMEFWGNHQE